METNYSNHSTARRSLVHAAIIVARDTQENDTSRRYDGIDIMANHLLVLSIKPLPCHAELVADFTSVVWC